MTLPSAFHNEMGRGGIELMRRLTDDGHDACFVGGCVRDALLDRPVKDIDIATSATPEQVIALFPEAIPTGLQHGTVTVPNGKFHYEITTFRSEEDYTDGRHPGRVIFIPDIAGDLARRDFTVNAMALSAEGELIDPFGGVNDIKSGVLRAVGNAAERFQEDALRMLRCIRFAAEYGFQIDRQTWEEVKLAAPGLSRIAMERVRGELERMIDGADPYRAIVLMRESGLLRWCKDKLRLPESLGISVSGADDPLKEIGRLTNGAARWSFWFHRMMLSPEEARFVCKALRHPNAFVEATDQTLRFHQSLSAAPSSSAREAWITAVLQFGASAAGRWLEWCEAVETRGEYSWTETYRLHGKAWMEEAAVLSLKELNVDGRMLTAALDKKSGPWLKHLLNRLLREAALGFVVNDEAALIQRAREIMEDN